MIEGLAADMMVVSDAGEKARAARRPVIGADAVARGESGTLPKLADGMVFTVISINGQLGFLQWYGTDCSARPLLNWSTIVCKRSSPSSTPTNCGA